MPVRIALKINITLLFLFVNLLRRVFIMSDNKKFSLGTIPIAGFGAGLGAVGASGFDFTEPSGLVGLVISILSLVLKFYEKKN